VGIQWFLGLYDAKYRTNARRFGRQGVRRDNSPFYIEGVAQKNFL
jgi:hypothetical protein